MRIVLLGLTLLASLSSFASTAIECVYEKTIKEETGKAYGPMSGAVNAFSAAGSRPSELRIDFEEKISAAKGLEDFHHQNFITLTESIDGQVEDREVFLDHSLSKRYVIYSVTENSSSRLVIEWSDEFNKINYILDYDKMKLTYTYAKSFTTMGLIKRTLEEYDYTCSEGI